MFNLFERFENSLTIMWECVAALRKDPELVVFPLLSGLSLAAVVATFVLPLDGTPYSPQLLFSDEGAAANRLATDPVAWLILFCYYFLNYFVISFFNAALIACVVVRMHSGDPGVMTGIRFAMNRLPQIISWALLAATVGVLLRILESERRIGTRIVAAILGVGWSLATFFVVPAMVIEKVGPVDAVRKSIAVMSETWGELLIARLSLGPVKTVFFLLALAPFFASLYIDVAQAPMIGFGISAVLVLGTILIFSTLDSIFLAALYLYGSDGRIADGFDEQHLSNAFIEPEE